MIFRKFAVRPVTAVVPNEAALVSIAPPRRLVATWHRDACTQRLTLAWKLSAIQYTKRAA